MVGPLALCHNLTVYIMPGGICFWVLIPIQEQMKTPSLIEGPPCTAGQAVDPKDEKYHSHCGYHRCAYLSRQFFNRC